tara:strand:+ start:51 stop:716 length:666 start_codon:yes stop_codon:yes gene_type:complete
MTIEQIVPAEQPDVAPVTPITKEPDAAFATPAAKEPEVEPVTTAAREHVNDDHRVEGDWESRWNKAARVGIRIDAAYVGIVFFLTLVMLLLTWRGTTYELLAYGCTSCSPIKFNQYAFFFIGGVLGGTMFGLKYLYKVVARGYWNIDRRLWRIFSPFLAGGSALAIGGLLDSGMLGLSIKSSSTSFYFSLGFISGYFADSALAKMQEIADTVFGSSARSSK